MKFFDSIRKDPLIFYRKPQESLWKSEKNLKICSYAVQIQRNQLLLEMN